MASVYITDDRCEIFKKAAKASCSSLSEYINAAVLQRIKRENPDLYQILVNQNLNTDRFGRDMGGDEYFGDIV